MRRTGVVWALSARWRGFWSPVLWRGFRRHTLAALWHKLARFTRRRRRTCGEVAEPRHVAADEREKRMGHTSALIRQVPFDPRVHLDEVTGLVAADVVLAQEG